jgi:hypothetical protein
MAVFSNSKLIVIMEESLMGGLINLERISSTNIQSYIKLRHKRGDSMQQMTTTYVRGTYSVQNQR